MLNRQRQWIHVPPIEGALVRIEHPKYPESPYVPRVPLSSERAVIEL